MDTFPEQEEDEEGPNPIPGLPPPTPTEVEEPSKGVKSEVNEAEESGGCGLPVADPVESPDSRSSITRSMGILLLRQAM